VLQLSDDWLGRLAGRLNSVYCVICAAGFLSCLLVDPPLLDHALFQRANYVQPRQVGLVEEGNLVIVVEGLSGRRADPLCTSIFILSGSNRI